MAHITTNASSLKIENLFVDGDTRTITLKNPRNNLSNEDFTNLQTFMQQNAIIVGDKYGGTFGRIESVTKITEARTYLDLS